MREPNASILTQNLAAYAEPLVSTGIIPTTASLSTLFGSARLAIAESTSRAVPVPNGESGQTRFRYTSKASRAEREVGTADGCPHPTVKPLALTRYLATLLLPPERGTPRRILTPFSGVGSEMIGALLAGWDHATGIEIDPEYVTIAHARIRHHARERSAPLFGGTP